MGRTIVGVSPQIDSCGGMIFKEAMRYYKRLSPVQQRWLGEEDMVQEGLNAAIEAERVWKEGGGNKFSTHLLHGLQWHLSKVCQRLEVKKRALSTVVELDAPVLRTDSHDETAAVDLVSSSVSAASNFTGSEDEWNSVKSFVELCRAVSSKAAMAFIRGLLFSEGYRVAPALCAELARAASKLHIGINDFRFLTQDENIRRIALRLTARFVMIEAGIEDEAICLECIECGVRLPFSAIRKGGFAPETMTCVACLKKLKASPQRCFGKQYDSGVVECRLHCLDRQMCQRFSGGEVKVMAKTKEEAAAAVADVDLGDVEQQAAELKKAKKKKGTVAVPVAAESDEGYSEKALRTYLNHYGDDKYPEPPAPEKAFAGRWPFNQGSILRFAFQWGYLGMTAVEMKKMLKVMDFGTGGGWDFAVKTVRKGVVGKTPPHRLVFQVDETDGGWRVYNVKKGAGYVEKPKAAPKPGPKPVDPETGARVGSKKQLLLAAVAREYGASSQELRDLTDWNDHSIRGFISGQKRAGVLIESQKWDDGTRTYVLRPGGMKPKAAKTADKPKAAPSKKKSADKKA